MAVNEGRIWLATSTLMNGYLEAESDPEIRELSGTSWLATNDTGRIVFADENEDIKAERIELWDANQNHPLVPGSPLIDPVRNQGTLAATGGERARATSPRFARGGGGHYRHVLPCSFRGARPPG